MSVEDQYCPLEGLSELSIPMIYSITESLVPEHSDDCHSIGMFHSADCIPLRGLPANMGLLAAWNMALEQVLSAAFF